MPRTHTAQNSRARGTSFAFVLVFAAACIAYLVVHELAGYSFPPPWPDEGSFLWPAIAVQEHNSLRAPQLNPDRHIMWMPPAYSIFLGSIFKITGFSLKWARMLSALMMLSALACLALIARRMRVPIPILILCSLVFLSRYFVMTGNLARMEAMLTGAICLSGLFLLSGRRYPALALLAFAPLIHPNALFLAAAVALYVVVGAARGRNGFRPSAADMFGLALCMIAWLAYAIHVGLHWQDFLHDMAFQLTWKQQVTSLETGFYLQLLTPWRLLLWGVLAGVIVGGRALDAPTLPLVILPISLSLVPVTPHEWYYGVFGGLAFLFTSMLVLDLADRTLERLRPERSPIQANVLAIGLLTVACVAGNQVGWVESPIGYPYSMRVWGMHITPSNVYIDDDDEAAIRTFLVGLTGEESSIRLRFNPYADALLFHDVEAGALHFVHPTFDETPVDVRIMHISRLIPDSSFRPRRKILKLTRDWPTIRARSKTERWVYHTGKFGPD